MSADAVCIDNGSYYLKAAVGPRKIQRRSSLVYNAYPSFLDPKARTTFEDGSHIDCLGSEVRAVASGRVVDHDLLMEIYGRVFDALGIDPTGHPFVLSEHPFAEPSQRLELSERMFEQFGVPSLNYSLDVLLTHLDLSGNTTHNVVVSMGWESISVSPVVYSVPDLERATRIDAGCSDLFMEVPVYDTSRSRRRYQPEAVRNEHLVDRVVKAVAKAATAGEKDAQKFNILFNTPSTKFDLGEELPLSNKTINKHSPFSIVEGAKILSKFELFGYLLVSREEYEEDPSVVIRRFPTSP